MRSPVGRSRIRWLPIETIQHRETIKQMLPLGWTHTRCTLMALDFMHLLAIEFELIISLAKTLSLSHARFLFATTWWEERELGNPWSFIGFIAVVRGWPFISACNPLPWHATSHAWSGLDEETMQGMLYMESIHQTAQPRLHSDFGCPSMLWWFNLRCFPQSMSCQQKLNPR